MKNLNIPTPPELTARGRRSVQESTTKRGRPVRLSLHRSVYFTVKQGRIHGRQMRPLAYLYSPRPLLPLLRHPLPCPFITSHLFPLQSTTPGSIDNRKDAFSCVRKKWVTDRQTDQRTDERTDGRTDPLIEVLRRI